MVRGILGFSFGFALVLNAIWLPKGLVPRTCGGCFHSGRGHWPALPRGVQSAELPVLELKRVDHHSIDSQRDNYQAGLATVGLLEARIVML